jgi:phage repressor protein C with HTH and peptisase S24 domain
MKFSEKIIKLRDMQNLTQEELGKKIKTHPRAIQKYESGVIEKPSKKTLEKISKAFPNYADWLLDKTQTIPLDLGGNIATIDFLDVSASAGTGITIFDERVIESIQINIDKLKQYYNITYKDSLKVISASGDSMKPTYNDKDLILVDTGDIDFRDGLWVFVDNDELFIKRLQKTPNGITAISDNNLYPNFDISRDMRLVAKIVGIWGFVGV